MDLNLSDYNFKRSLYEDQTCILLSDRPKVRGDNTKIKGDLRPRQIPPNRGSVLDVYSNITIWG